MTTQPTLRNPSHTDRKPKIAIVGAGIAGLTLAILLEHQGVEYDIYERAKEVKPLGSSITLGAAVAPLFKQLGIYDEFMRLGKACNSVHNYTNRREFNYTMDFGDAVEMSGYDGYMIARPVLYKLLQSHVPSHRIHLDRKVLSTIQDKDGVQIHTSDDQTYTADILVGADGAHSMVRQGLYASLKAEGRLPATDAVALPFSSICLVGQTTPLDPAQFPQLAMEESQFINIPCEETPYSWATFTTKQNTICWSVLQFLDKESNKADDSFRNSEWGPEAAEAMCKEIRAFAIPGAASGATPLTLGDLIDQTPRDLISKVMLEEKVFETWYSGRTVLIGDACHKISPAGGQGAMLAIHDAVCLANWISVLPSTEIKDLETIFCEYKEERIPLAKASFERAQMFRNVTGKNLVSRLTRYLSKRVPKWLWNIVLTKMVTHRPQVSFMPLVQDPGKVRPVYQASLQKTLEIHQGNGSIPV